MTFTRYAIYYVPPEGTGWGSFATSWLGWDMAAGQATPHPAIDGVDVSAVTAAPRKYGLHATMKPPFRLTSGCTETELRSACTTFARTQPPVSLTGLEIARLGRFLALRPLGDTQALNDLAAACVRAFDGFRAPATQPELEKRRIKGLSSQQDANLTRWGYPYVMDAFRFHITLSGRLNKQDLSRVEMALQDRLAPILPSPFLLADIALVGEAENGQFHLIHRYALSG